MRRPRSPCPRPFPPSPLSLRRTLPALLALGLASTPSLALNATETNTTLSLSNDRVHFVLNKTTSYMTSVVLDGVDLLGTPVDATSAIGPYVDAVFTPKQDNYVSGP